MENYRKDLYKLLCVHIRPFYHSIILSNWIDLRNEHVHRMRTEECVIAQCFSIGPVADSKLCPVSYFEKRLSVARSLCGMLDD